MTHVPIQKKHILLRPSDARLCAKIPQGFLRPAPVFGPEPGHFLEASCPGSCCCSLCRLPPVIPEFVRLSRPSLMVPPRAGTGGSSSAVAQCVCLPSTIPHPGGKPPAINSVFTPILTNRPSPLSDKNITSLCCTLSHKEPRPAERNTRK